VLADSTVDMRLFELDECARAASGRDGQQGRRRTRRTRGKRLTLLGNGRSHVAVVWRVSYARPTCTVDDGGKRPSELRLRALRNRLVLLRPQITRPGPRDWLDGRCIAYDRMDTLRLSLPSPTRINAVDSSRVSLPDTVHPAFLDHAVGISVSHWNESVHSSAQTRRCPLVKSMTGSEK
jgi:hypothetical protein